MTPSTRDARASELSREADATIRLPAVRAATVRERGRALTVIKANHPTSRDRGRASNSNRASHAVVLALCLAALALTGCPSIVVPGDIGESPRVWVESMREAVRTDNVNNFYYLLTHDIRRQYGLWAVDHAWPEVKQQLRLDPETTELVEVEYLAESPFPPAPAARVRLRYDYAAGGEVEEDFLLLLEIDEPWAGDEGGDDVGERWPQWRVQYPYAPYQRHATWFKDVEPASGAPASGAR